jgi:hypothetical protein
MASCKGEPIVRNQGYLLEAVYWHETDGDGTILPPTKALNRSMSRKTSLLGFNPGVNPNRFTMGLETALAAGRIVVCWQGKVGWTDKAQNHLYFSADSEQMGAMKLIPNVPTPKELQAYHRALGVMFQENSAGTSRKGTGEATPQKLPTLQWVSLQELAPGSTSRAAVSLTVSKIRSARTVMGGRSQGKKTCPHVRGIAKYYQAQLDLYAEMCCGSSRYCSRAVSKQFPYELLAVGIRDSKLPDALRASFARLMHNLYVDVFPHEAVTLPSLVRHAGALQKIDVKVVNRIDSPGDAGTTEGPSIAVAHECSGRCKCWKGFLCSRYRCKPSKVNPEPSSPNKQKSGPFQPNLRLWLVDSAHGRGVLDGGAVLIIIMFLVLASLVSVLASMISVGADSWGHGNIYSFYFDNTILCAFVVEASLRMYAVGVSNYFGDGLCLIDFFVIAADVAALVVQLVWTEAGACPQPCLCCCCCAAVLLLLCAAVVCCLRASIHRRSR